MSEVLDDLILLIGRDNAYNICLKHGGQRVYFGKKSMLQINCISEDNIKKLRNYYLNDTIEFPLVKPELAKWLIFEKNYSQDKVAAIFHTTRSTVRRWLVKTSPQPVAKENTSTQLSLFD